MQHGSILNAVRTPAGHLQGYHLIIDDQEVTLKVSDIKDLIKSGSLEIEGAYINAAGAFIVPGSTLSESTEDEPVSEIQVAKVISALRTPNGRLKGYKLLIEDAEVLLSCEEIKDRIRNNKLLVKGMTLNKVGALILSANSEEENDEQPVIVINKKAEGPQKKVVRKVVKVVKTPAAKTEETKIAVAAPVKKEDVKEPAQTVKKVEFKESAAPVKKITEPKPVPRSTILLKDQPVTVKSVSEESIFSAANASHPGKAFVKRRIL